MKRWGRITGEREVRHLHEQGDGNSPSADAMRTDEIPSLVSDSSRSPVNTLRSCAILSTPCIEQRVSCQLRLRAETLWHLPRGGEQPWKDDRCEFPAQPARNAKMWSRQVPVGVSGRYSPRVKRPGCCRRSFRHCELQTSSRGRPASCRAARAPACRGRLPRPGSGR